MAESLREAGLGHHLAMLEGMCPSCKVRAIEAVHACADEGASRWATWGFLGGVVITAVLLWLRLSPTCF